MTIPLPPKLSNLPYGTKLICGQSSSTVIADFDFETYSSAGYVWDELSQKYKPPHGAKNKGLSTVGVVAYSEHPSTEVLCLSYDLKDGKGKRLWKQNMLPPIELFNHIAQGKLIEAWNIAFEYWIWKNVCEKKYGWPSLPVELLRCAMAKSRAFALPGSLDLAGEVLKITNRKDKDGKRLLGKFSVPRNSTKTDLRTRHTLEDYPYDAELLYNYNLQDIAAEAEISSLVPDLNEFELKFWQYDQRINRRGVQIDVTAIDNAIAVIESIYKHYNAQLQTITNGAVKASSELHKIKKWLEYFGIYVNELDSETVSELLRRDDLLDIVRKVLTIRALTGSAAVKKLYAMKNMASEKNRLHELFIYHSARTGRAAGAGVQPQNLPNSGLDVNWCECGKHSCGEISHCPWCGKLLSGKKIEWNPGAVENVIELISHRSFSLLEYFFQDAIGAVSGCLRGMFIAREGHDLICSDYSAIEAVVLAAIAGEEWRLEVFRTHGKIYEMSASKITGIDFDDFLLHKVETGQHHPMRKKIGKVSELASGFQGWIGAWKQFGADEFFNDDEIKQAILAWRDASPNIVKLWGSQAYGQYSGLEGMAVAAILNPGTPYTYRGITYIVKNDVLYCQLPSGRYLSYHKPRVSNSDRRPGTYAISFEGYNSNPKNGSIGWIRMYTYGGKLTENVVQAVSRDILAHAIVNLEDAGYPVVLHIHDEIVAEVPENTGSVAEFEKIMSKLPDWCRDWPVKAKGGWRAKRYAK